MVLPPSPGTPGEGGGEGTELGTTDKGNTSHPNPLPEYQARGQEDDEKNLITPGWEAASPLIAILADGDAGDLPSKLPRQD